MACVYTSHPHLWIGCVIFIILSIYCMEPVHTAKKLNDFIRHYEELTYDTERLHNDHSRAKRSADPQVYLRFKALNRQFNVRLRRDTSTFSRDAKFEYGGQLHAPSISHIYSGELDNVRKSFVHGSIINGIFAGTINTPTETYHIEKSEVHFGTPQKFHSVIYADRDVTDAPLRKRRAAEAVPTCANSDPAIADWMREVQNSNNDYIKVQKRSEPLTEEETWAHKYSEQAQGYYEKRAQNNRKKRANARKRTTCTLYLEADPMLWQYMTGPVENKNLGYEPDRAMEEITSLFATHVSGIKNIYESTQFIYGNIGPHSGFSFVVRRVKINIDEDCEGALRQTNVFCRPNIDVSNFLNSNSLRNHDLYCLAYVFTYRDFTGGTLGLAWVGSPTKASGGICELYKEYTESNNRVEKSLNTGIVTLVNYGSRVPPKVSTLTFAHEVGHNFGSPHDGGRCVPSLVNPRDQEGNYIMFASATSGDRANNNKFSQCSIGNMTLVLDAIMNGSNGKTNCLVESEEAFCGNAIKEPGEVCDCGFEADCNKTETCCHPQEDGPDKKCTLKTNSECSPSQGPCCKSDCTKYRLAEGKDCQPDTECSMVSQCNGTSAECPKPKAKADLTPCNDFTQVCKNGDCQGTICEKIKWEQCYMTDTTKDQKADKGKLCFVACRDPEDAKSECISTGDKTILERPENKPLRDLLEKNNKKDIRLQPGAPCNYYKGYCDVFQKCRGVDADGPLARLKNLLLNEETLNTIRDWIIEYWWAVLLMGIGLVVFMGLFIKLCAVHTPSSNPKKAPARKISLKPQPRAARQQGPPPGYPGPQNRAGPPHGKGRGPTARPPPYNPHNQMYEMRGHNRA